MKESRLLLLAPFDPKFYCCTISGIKAIDVSLATMTRKESNSHNIDSKDHDVKALWAVVGGAELDV